MDSSTPSYTLSLFRKSVPCLNPLGYFLFMSLPPSSSVLYFWVHVSVSIFAHMGVFPCLLHSGQSVPDGRGFPPGLPHAVCTVGVASFTGPKPVWDNSQSLQSSAIMQEANEYNLPCNHSFALLPSSVLDLCYYRILRDFTSVSGCLMRRWCIMTSTSSKQLNERWYLNRAETLLQFPTIPFGGAWPFRDWGSLNARSLLQMQNYLYLRLYLLTIHQ